MSVQRREERVEIIKGILVSGNSVELPATGYSMFPAMRPGDKVMIKGIRNKEDLQKGNIIVYEINGTLVMHRLIAISENESGKPQYLTRGDSMAENDRAVSEQQLIAVAYTFQRGGKKSRVRVFVPGKCWHFYNRIVLWGYFKSKKYLGLLSENVEKGEPISH
jgi:signal peptidase I